MPINYLDVMPQDAIVSYIPKEKLIVLEDPRSEEWRLFNKNNSHPLSFEDWLKLKSNIEKNKTKLKSNQDTRSTKQRDVALQEKIKQEETDKAILQYEENKAKTNKVMAPIAGLGIGAGLTTFFPEIMVPIWTGLGAKNTYQLGKQTYTFGKEYGWTDPKTIESGLKTGLTGGLTALGIKPTFNYLSLAKNPKAFVLNSMLNRRINMFNGIIPDSYFSSFTPGKWYRRTETPEVGSIQELGYNVTTRDLYDFPERFQTAASRARDAVMNLNIKSGITLANKFGSSHGNVSQGAYGSTWESGLAESGLFPKVILEGNSNFTIPASINPITGLKLNRSSFIDQSVSSLPLRTRIGFKTGKMPLEGLRYFQEVPGVGYRYMGELLPNKTIRYQQPSNVTTAIDPNGKIRILLSSHSIDRPREFTLEPLGNNQFRPHFRIWNGENIPGNITEEEKQLLFNGLYGALPNGAELLIPQSSTSYLATPGTVSVFGKRFANDLRYTPGSAGSFLYRDADGTIKTFNTTSFIKKNRSLGNDFSNLDFSDSDFNINKLKQFEYQLILSGAKTLDPKYMVSTEAERGIHFNELTDDAINVIESLIYPRLQKMRPWMSEEELLNNIKARLQGGYSVYPKSTFVKAGEETYAGAYYPSTDHIAIREGYTKYALPHEVRHKLDNGIELTQEELNYLESAYGNEFKSLTGFTTSSMSDEMVTTNLDSRGKILGDAFKDSSLTLQNKIIDKVPDETIIKAVKTSNAYGKAFIEKLESEGKLTHERVTALREAMKYVGIFTGTGIVLTQE